MIKAKIYMENKLCKSLRRILCLAAMLVVLPVFSIGQECASVSPWNIYNEIEHKGEGPKTQYVNSESLRTSYVNPIVRVVKR